MEQTKRDETDSAIMTPTPKDQGKSYMFDRPKTPRFAHMQGPLMDRSMARPPFVDARKGPNDKRFEIIESGELMSKNKKVTSFSIQRMSPRKPMNVREHFLQDYKNEQHKSIQKES